MGMANGDLFEVFDKLGDHRSRYDGDKMRALVIVVGIESGKWGLEIYIDLLKG